MHLSIRKSYKKCLKHCMQICDLSTHLSRTFSFFYFLARTMYRNIKNMITWVRYWHLLPFKKMQLIVPFCTIENAIFTCTKVPSNFITSITRTHRVTACCVIRTRGTAGTADFCKSYMKHTVLFVRFTKSNNNNTFKNMFNEISFTQMHIHVQQW